MRTPITIFCAGILLAFTLPLQAQVPYDLSKAKEFRTVWKVLIGGQATEPHYIPGPCDNPGMDILTVGTSTGGRQFFTQPRIDTMAPQPEGWGSAYMPIDYDGVPPLEYMNINGRIDRCDGGSNPLKKTRIDTVNCWALNIRPAYPVDIDDDGHLDVICDVGGAGMTAHFIMGGPQWGRGCERVLSIPRVPREQTRAKVVFHSLFKSANGRWRLVQKERDPSDLSPWMLLYDVAITRDGDSLKATYTKLDSLLGGSSSIDDDPFGNVEVLVDTVAKRDYVLIQRAVNFDPVIVAVERFDVTEGSLTSTGEKITGLTFVFNQNLGYQLKTDKPVIAITSSEGYLFCYADNIRQPFARMDSVEAFIYWAVINDQTGDGAPDIVMTNDVNSSVLRLISLDPTVSVNEDPKPDASASTARLAGDVLEVMLTTSLAVSADLVSTDGRMTPALMPVQGHAGQNRYDLSATLRPLPAGAYYLRVRMGGASSTIPVIR